MNARSADLAMVVSTLRDEDYLSADTAEAADAVVADLSDIQPWYIRAMVAFGAWLSSLLLIGFVAGIGIKSETGIIVIGVLLMGAAVFMRRQSANDFAVQCALATCLAGQALAAWGIADVVGQDFEVLMLLIIAINALLFFVYPDRLYRVLSVLLITSCVTALLFKWDLFVLLPFCGPALTAAMVYIYVRQAELMRLGKGELLRPLTTGLMLSAFGCLLLSTVYIIPDLSKDFLIYPRPWISTLLFGALFIFLGTRVWQQFLGPSNLRARNTLYGLMVVVIAAAWAVPGLLLALIVTMLGAATGNRGFIGAGVGFLVVFVTTYFYGIQVTMMVKSMTLVATGAAILFARWQLLRAIEGESGDV